MAQDIYMNFMVLKVTSAVSSATMVGGIPSNGQINTGMGARTRQGMKVHKVELLHASSWNGAGDGERIEIALSTQSARSTVPQIDQQGVISKWDQVLSLGAAGDSHNTLLYPLVQEFLPPVLIAAPRLNLYVDCSANWAGAQIKDYYARLGFTWEEMDQNDYLEAWETWSFAN